MLRRRHPHIQEVEVRHHEIIILAEVVEVEAMEGVATVVEEAILMHEVMLAESMMMSGKLLVLMGSKFLCTPRISSKVRNGLIYHPQ